MPSLTHFTNATPHRSKHHQRGFTLIEVLVTVVVVSIGLLGLAGLQINGLRANMSSEARSKATLMANDIVERMRANPIAITANLYANIDTSTLNCNTSPSPFCSNTSTNTAATCNTSQMASFDAWIWGCGMPPAGGAQRGGVINRLNNGNATVSCTDNDPAGDADPCSPGSIHTVVISWNELSPNATANISAGTSNTQNISLVVVP